MASDYYRELLYKAEQAHYLHEDARRRGIATPESSRQRKEAEDALLAAITDLKQQRDRLREYAWFMYLEFISDYVVETYDNYLQHGDIPEHDEIHEDPS